MVTPHTGWYMPQSKDEWIYEIAGWNPVVIAISVVGGMIEDGFLSRDEMDDVKNDYVYETLNIIGSRDTEAADGGLKKAIEDAVDQLIDGIEVEFEHVPDGETSKENVETAFSIACDHVLEFPDYYTYLEKMERELKRKWKK